jgi:hypothetical protein
VISFLWVCHLLWRCVLSEFIRVGSYKKRLKLCATHPIDPTAKVEPLGHPSRLPTPRRAAPLRLSTLCRRRNSARSSGVQGTPSGVGITAKFIRHMSSYRFIQYTTVKAVRTNDRA